MQVSTGAESRISGATLLRKTIQSEGILGLFRGYSTTVLREVPFSLIQMPLWEWLKRSWAKYNKQEQVSPGQSALCGAIAGIKIFFSFHNSILSFFREFLGLLLSIIRNLNCIFLIT